MAQQPHVIYHFILFHFNHIILSTKQGLFDADKFLVGYSRLVQENFFNKINMVFDFVFLWLSEVSPCLCDYPLCNYPRSLITVNNIFKPDMWENSCFQINKFKIILYIVRRNSFPHLHLQYRALSRNNCHANQ